MNVFQSSGMEDLVAQIADNCFRLVMADGSWEAIGFGRRPRRGLIWRFTTPAWKVALEDRVHRELLVIFSAAHVGAFGSTRDELLRSLVKFYWGVDGRFGQIFPSAEACQKAINEYLGAPCAEWHKLLCDHLEVFTVPDKKLSARLLVGCVQFAMNVPMIRLWIDSCGVDMACWPKPMTQDEAIRDHLAAINQIFETGPNRPT